MHSSHPMPLDPSTRSALTAIGSAVHHAVVDSREFRTFHNGLRILLNLDGPELVGSGAVDSIAALKRFYDNPHLFFVNADDAQAAALWRMIQERQPEDLRVPVPEMLQAAE